MIFTGQPISQASDISPVRNQPGATTTTTNSPSKSKATEYLTKGRPILGRLTPEHQKKSRDRNGDKFETDGPEGPEEDNCSGEIPSKMLHQVSKDFLNDDHQESAEKVNDIISADGGQSDPMDNSQHGELNHEQLDEIEQGKTKISREEPVELYDYQKELAEAALGGENSIICAPTGSGKTITAAHICKTLRDRCRAEKKPFKALFIVCIRTLTNQQKDAFHAIFTGDDKLCVEAIKPKSNLASMVNVHDIVMLTAQIFVNALKRTEIMKTNSESNEDGGLRISDFDLLIFDECHHTDLKHPYNQIMRLYQKEKDANGSQTKMPQILGLTASLGAGSGDSAVEHYIRMCGNLNCKVISTVRKNVKDLEAHNPKPIKEHIEEVQPREPNDPFITSLTQIMKTIEENISNVRIKLHKKGSQPYENWATNEKIVAEEEGARLRRVQFEALLALNRGLMTYHDLPASDCLKSLIEELRTLLPREPTPEEEMVKKLIVEGIEKLRPLAETPDASTNPKMVKLVELLVKLNGANKNAIGTNTIYFLEKDF